MCLSQAIRAAANQALFMASELERELAVAAVLASADPALDPRMHPVGGVATPCSCMPSAWYATSVRYPARHRDWVRIWERIGNESGLRPAASGDGTALTCPNLTRKLKGSGPQTAHAEHARPALTPRLTWALTGWQVLGSNQRRLSRRFYRPLPLATRATCLKPSTKDGTLKDSGTFQMSQHLGV